MRGSTPVHHGALVCTPAHTLIKGGCFCVPSHLDLVDAVHVNSVLRLVCLAWIGRAAIDVHGAAVSALATDLTLRKCVVCGIAVQCPTGPTPVCLGELNPALRRLFCGAAGSCALQGSSLASTPIGL